jgi:F-type H+-transporting ATPase subunit alpha
LKLDLAQYRELAAFAKLSSDLDKNTQATLTRGEKITEVLKQPQYQPQAVEDQVMVIYAATRGHLTDIPTPRLQEWSHSFISFVHDKHPEIPQSIVDTKALSDDVAKSLASVIDEFNKSF